jgi:uncharacterized protein
MPATLTYPGVYIEELPSSVHSIAGVATSITAFIGRALRGPTDGPVRIHSFPEFERTYGGFWADSTLGYAVYHFFLNGGSDAVIVRVHKGATAATLSLPPNAHPLKLVAANPGKWGGALRVRVDYDTRGLQPGEATDSLFNLSIRDTQTGVTEVFRNLSIEKSNPRYAAKVLQTQSELVRVDGDVAARPDKSGDLKQNESTDPLLNSGSSTAFDAGAADGDGITDNEINPGGVQLLDMVDLFNILCIPPLAPSTDVAKATWDFAVGYASKRRAFVIVDAPATWTKTSDVKPTDVVSPTDHGAIYFPRVMLSDPLQENRLRSFAPCGVVAGVYSRTDAQRGVWKAPAGIEATLQGASGLATGDKVAVLTDDQNGELNPIGVNCLRTFPVVGTVVWGARTLNGADRLASQWKYIPVRRLALFIEESLYRGTQWVVFEPNDEPLWAQIRLNVGAFMQTLFRQGAFQGASPKEAYFVKCNSETTTQTDIDNGIVNIIVGFAPLKPAEFVVIKIQQIAQQA